MAAPTTVTRPSRRIAFRSSFSLAAFTPDVPERAPYTLLVVRLTDLAIPRAAPALSTEPADTARGSAS
ncbi:MAG: hypothetical protein H0T74_00715 [Rubrobacteraceae bacterium]|nr:hypothetical protein [Rubrobacteraceae bacterium]